MVKCLARFPEQVSQALIEYEPSVITRYILDLCAAFNRFYHEEHILVDNEAEKLAKVALVKAAKNVIANGLALLGMKAPEKM